MEKQITEFNKKYARKRRLKRIVALLCVFVMLFTVNSLKMVAVTLSRVPMCGLKAHQHKPKCYDADGNLICGKVEHEHTDACYQQAPVDPNLSDSLVLVEDGRDKPVDDTGLVLDMDVSDLGLEDVLQPQTAGAGEAGEKGEETPVYRLGNRALLSRIIKATGLNLKLNNIQEVGIVDNDGSQVGLVEIYKRTNGDYRITALKPFEQVDLAIVMADEVKVVRLADGRANETEFAPEPVSNDAEQTEVEETEPIEIEVIENDALPTEDEQGQAEDGQEEPDAPAEEARMALNVKEAQFEVDAVPEVAQTEEVTSAEAAQTEEESVPKAVQVEEPVPEAIEAPEEPAPETAQPDETAPEETQSEEPASEAVPAEESAPEETQSEEPASEAAQQEESVTGETQSQEPAPEAAREEDAPAEMQMEEEPAPAEVEEEETPVPEETQPEDGSAPAEVQAEEASALEEIQVEEAVELEDALPKDALETVDDGQGDPADAPKDEGSPREAAQFTEGSREIAVNDCVVTLSWSAEAHIPDNVEIAIVEIEKGTEDYDMLYHQALAELPEPDQAVTQVMRFFDITLYGADGEKLEPDAPVSVQVFVNEAIDSEVNALHCETVGAPMQTVDANAEGESVAFDAPSFSVYGVNYTKPAKQESVSAQVSVDLSRVDTMAAATVEGMGVSLSISDLLEGRDEAVQSDVDAQLDAQAFAQAAKVTSADVPVEDGRITLSGEAVSQSAVSLQLETTEVSADYVTTVTTRTVDIVLSDYAGRTESIDEGNITVTALGDNSLPADAKASVEENVAVPESVEVRDGEAAVAFDINLTNANGDAITGPVAVTVMPSELNVLAELPEGAAAENIVYTLIHVHDDGTTESMSLPAEAVVVDENGNVESFSFETESFSMYVLKYTVDFEYTDPTTGETFTWSWGGRGSYSVASIMSRIGVEGEITDVSLTRTIDAGGAENALYLEEKEDGWYLTSEEAFEDTFELTVVVDGVSYVIVVTDDVTWEGHTFTSLASLIDTDSGEKITVSFREGTNNIVQGNTSTSEMTLKADIAYTIRNKIDQLNQLVTDAMASSDKNVYLDYDMTALINAHENLSQITGSGELYKGGNVMGEFFVTDGHVLVRLDATKLDTQASSFKGTFDLEMIVSTTTTTISGNETFEFPGTSDTLTIVWPAHQHGHGTKTVDTNNTAIYTAEDDGYLYYNYTLTIDGGLDLTNLKLSDTLPEGMELDGNVTITRNITTHNQQSTRTKYDDTTYGVWGAWGDTSTETSTTTRSATPTVADGVMSLDVGSAVGLDSVSNITENDTTRTRSYTQSTYTLTYRTKIRKSDALSQMGQGQNSTQLTNTARWNEDTTEIPGGSATVTITKQEMTPGHKVVDGNNSDNIQIAYRDMVDVGGTKYARIDYIVSITEPIDATSAVLTDKLSALQKLENTTAELFIDDVSKGNVTFGSTGEMGETISFDLQAALQALNPQQESFTHGKTYKLKYTTLVPYNAINTTNGATITNETDWTINNTGVPGEDKTVVVTRKPYLPNFKTDLLGNNTTVSGTGPWTIPWEIKTTQVQDASQVIMRDKYSMDQTLDKTSFKLYIDNAENYTIPAEYIVDKEDDGNYHKFEIDIDQFLRDRTPYKDDPVFKADKWYKITYNTTTTQYDNPETSNREKSSNQSKWIFDGKEISYVNDDVVLKKLEYQPGKKKVKCRNSHGVMWQDTVSANSVGHYVDNWAMVEPELVKSSSDPDRNDQLLLHYRIEIQEPFGYPEIKKAVLTDTYDSLETLQAGSFHFRVDSTEAQEITIPSEYVTIDTSAHTFTLDMVSVVNNLLSPAQFTANTKYYLEYQTIIPLTDEIKQLLKTKDGNDQLVGFTVRNQQAWHFEGTPGNEDKPGNETTYTFKEKPYNGGDKSVAVYDTASGELISTSTGTGKTVITVDNDDNTLKYTISLTESRNTTKAVLHDEYSAGQTLKQDSFKVTFQHEGQTVTLNISTDNGLTLNDNNTFDIDLTQVLSANGYTFTKDVTYNISYESTVNTIGEPGSGATSTDTSDGRYQNHAGWTFDNGNGTGEGGDTDIHLEESTYTPGSKAVKVEEEVGHADYWTSDWATLEEPEYYSDNTARISSVFDGETYHLNYSIIIEEAKPVTTAVLTDTFQGSANQTLVPGSFTLSIDGGEYMSIPDSYVTSTGSGFTLRLTDFLASKSLSFQKNTEYEIGFQTTTTTKNNTSVNGDGADNKAKWTFDNEATVDGGHTETHLKVVPKVEKTYYNAAGKVHGEVNFGEQVKYVINIGSADDVLNGYWLKDDMTSYHHLDRSKGITVKRGNEVLANLITENTPSGWYFQAIETQTWNSDIKHEAFWLNFPSKQDNGGVDFKGPITIEYYANVGTQQQTGIVGLKDVLNTVKSQDTEITTKFQLSSGTVELDKIALPIEDDTLENDNVIAWWRVNLTPVEMSLQNLYLKDFDARFSTVSAENAASGTGTTGMYVGTTPGTTYHVYYTNAGAGHAADDPVPGNLYALDSGNLKFTGDIQEPVYVVFATIGNDYGSYNGGNIYLTNSARLTDSGDKTVGGPDTATKEYVEKGTITATKTFNGYTREHDGKATINWQFRIEATGTASVYGYYLKESVYRFSNNLDNVQNGSYLGLDLSTYAGTVITDANDNTLTQGSDYTIDYNYGIKFLKRIPCPITVDIPMTINSLPSGTTYLYNKAILYDRDGNPTDVEGTGEITDWTIKVDKTIENNGQKPIAPNFDQTVTYKILANSARDPLPAGTTIVTDVLPAGMEYVDDETMYITFINSENTYLQLNNNQYVFGTLWNYLQPTVGTTVINGKTHQTLTWNFSKATKEAFDAQNSKVYGLQDYFNSNDTSTYSLNLNGASVEIGYKAKLTDSEIERLQNLGTNVPQIYNNTVTVTQGDDASGSDDVEWDYTWKNGLKKEDITDAHYAQMDSKPPILWYKVSINPDARMMNNGNNLIMVDKIPTAMELNLGTVQVKYANGDVVSEAKVSYDGITRELTVRVPDGKACYVTFNATIENPQLDKAVSYTNSVKLKGESTWTDTVTETHTVTTLSGTVDYTIERGFFIEKVDGNNITLKLPGAEFTLYKASFPALSNLEQVYTDYANYENDKDSVNYDLTRFVLNPDDDTHPVVKTADTNGRVSFEHLDIGHLYYWVETKTPDDTYSAGMFAEPQYVILYQTNNKIVDPESYAHAKLLDHLISDANGIIVNTAKENYVWTATNFKETQYSVQKTWQDNDNVQRPKYIYVQLLQDGEPYDDPGTPANEGLVRIEADNLGDWEYTWFDLPAKQDGGVDYVYTACELTPEQMLEAGLITQEEKTALEAKLEGYVTIYQSTSSGVEIINRKGDETSILIEKAWEDEDNVSLLRPGFITVKLYRETLNGAEAGTVVQVAPSVTDSTHIEEATRSIRIYANDNWKKEIVGLETNNGAGVNYRYYLQEDDVNNYITTYQTPISLVGGEVGGLADSDGFVRITNRLDGVQVTKRWLDENGQEAWPANVTFKLVKRDAEGVYHSVATPLYYSSRGEAWSDEITTTTDNRKAIWLHLDPLGENEAYFAVEYEIAGVEESAITRDTSVQVETGLKQPALSFTMNGVHYDVTGGTSSSGTGIVVNAPRTRVEFTKQWFNTSETADADNNPQNLKIQVQLRRYSNVDGQEDTAFALRDWVFELDNTENTQTEGDITFTDHGNWTASWDNLPLTGWVNGESEVYQYRVSETAVVNTATNGVVADFIAVEDKDHRAIRNYYPDQEISVSKAWLPEPEGAWSISAKLQVAQRLVERSGLRDEDAPWSEFADYDPEGEETTQTVTIGVDASGNRISGTTYDSATGKYTTKVTLPKYRYVPLTNSLYELKFTAVEDTTALAELGYILIDTVTEGNEITFTNESQNMVVTVEKKWEPKPDPADNPSVTVQLKRYMMPLPQTEATVTKVWDDDNNRDGIRPSSITVTLSNGQTVTLNAGNSWTGTINDLPMYDNEQPVTYTWSEGTVSGYTQSSAALEGTTTTLTNSHTPETVSASITLVWEDENDKDGVRPASVTATLSNGQTVELSAANSWTATISDLPKYESGSAITYTWNELSVDGYTKTAGEFATKDASLTLCHEPTAVLHKVNIWYGKYGFDSTANEKVDVVDTTGTVTLTVKVPTGTTSMIAKYWPYSNGYGNYNNLATEITGTKVDGNPKDTWTYTVSGITENDFNIGVCTWSNDAPEVTVTVGSSAGKRSAPMKFSSMRSPAKAPAMQLMGTTPVVTHADALPATAPTDYVEDASFTAENITLTLNDSLGWKRSFAQQPKLDFLGRPYYYFVEEISYTPSEDYWIDSYSGDPLNTSGTITVTNKKSVSSVKVTKLFSGIDALPSGFRITNSFNSEVFTVANATAGNGKGTPYEWVIDDVPVGTTVTFTESGFGVDNYNLTVNRTAITTGANVTATATSAEDTVNVASFSNDYAPKLGALKLKKIVTVDGKPVNDHSEPSPADGAYLFTISVEGESDPYKYVWIIIQNGQMYKYIVLDPDELIDYYWWDDWGYWYSKDTQPFTVDNDWAIVPDLAPGRYVVQESGGVYRYCDPDYDEDPYVGVLIQDKEPNDDVTLVSINGNTTAKSITLTVEPGDATAAHATAQATFTNNKVLPGALRLKKVVDLSGDTSGDFKGGEFYFVISGPNHFKMYVLAEANKSGEIFKYYVTKDEGAYRDYENAIDWWFNEERYNIKCFDSDLSEGLVIDNLEPGAYTIEESRIMTDGLPPELEIELESITVNPSGSHSTDSRTATVTVEPGTDASTAVLTTFTNSVVPSKTELKVKKVWLNSDGTELSEPWDSSIQSITFKVTRYTRTKKNGSGVDGGHYIESGAVSFDGQETLTITSQGKGLKLTQSQTGSLAYTMEQTSGGDPWSVLISGLESGRSYTDDGNKYQEYYAYKVEEISVNGTGTVIGFVTSYVKNNEVEEAEISELFDYDTAYIRNKKTDEASLILSKALKASTDSPVSGKLEYTDGTYTFTIVGPQEAAEQVRKTVAITTANGRMTSATIDGENAGTAFNASTGVTISGLTPGTYTITESEPNPVGAPSGSEMYVEGIEYPVREGNMGNLKERTATVLIGAGETSTAEVKYTNELAPDTVTHRKMVLDVNDSEETTPFVSYSEHTWEDSADYDIGDHVPYRVTGFLPQKTYRSKTTYYYEVEDVMQNLRYVPGTGHMFAFVKGPNDPVGVWYQVDEYFTFTSSDTGSANTGWLGNAGDTITTLTARTKETAGLKAITRGKAVNWGSGGTHYNERERPTWDERTGDEYYTGINADEIQYLQLRYYAELLPSANIGTDGNANDARIRYTQDNETTTTGWDRNRVFTYKLRVPKTYFDADGNAVTPATHATFKLSKMFKDEGWKPVRELTEPNAEGNVYEWNGIDDGVYLLEEVSAPDGFVKMDQPIKLTLYVGHDFEDNDPKIEKTNTKTDANGKLITYDNTSLSLDIEYAHSNGYITNNDSDKSYLDSGDNGGIAVGILAEIPNYHVKTIEATKVWKNGNTAVDWPSYVESVEFTLFKTVNGVETQVTSADLEGITNPVTVTADTADHKASWTDLPPRYWLNADTSVTPAVTAGWYDATYSVKETGVTYTAGSSWSNLETLQAVAEAYGAVWANGTVANNLPTTERHATKQWVDNDNANNHRPDSITFTLSGTWDDDGTARAVDLSAFGVTDQRTIQPDQNGEWPQADWTGLPEYTLDGKVITYDVTETPVDDYRASVSGTGTPWTVTNTELTERTAVKEWAGTQDDKISSITYTIRRKMGNLEDGDFNARPENTVSIVKERSAATPADRTEVLYSENGYSWDYTWNDLEACWRIVGATERTGAYEYSVKETGFVYDGVTYTVNDGSIVADTTANGYDAAKAHTFWKTSATTSGTTTTFHNDMDETYIEVVKKWSLNGGDPTVDSMDATSEVRFYLHRSDNMVIDSATLEPKPASTDSEPTQANPFTIYRGADNTWSLRIDGLEKSNGTGDYRFWIVEEPLPGYSTSPTIVMVKDGAVVNVGSGENAAPGGSTITITNSRFSVALPATGGAGTTLYYVAGTSLLLLALALMLRRKIRQE